jgi:hypothetical protein
MPLEMASRNARTSSLYHDISECMKEVHVTLKTAVQNTQQNRDRLKIITNSLMDLLQTSRLRKQLEIKENRFVLNILMTVNIREEKIRAGREKN